MKLKTFLLIFIFLGTGCSSMNQGGDTPRFPRYLEHRVEYPGETLGAIARWYTGSSTNWTAIQAANPEIRPNRIKIGMLVKIPDNLVTKSAKMPPPPKSDKFTVDEGKNLELQLSESPTAQLESVKLKSKPNESISSDVPPLPEDEHFIDTTVATEIPDIPPYEPPPAKAELGTSAGEQTVPTEQKSGSSSFLSALGKALAPSKGPTKSLESK